MQIRDSTLTGFVDSGRVSNQSATSSLHNYSSVILRNPAIAINSAIREAVDTSTIKANPGLKNPATTGGATQRRPRVIRRISNRYADIIADESWEGVVEEVCATYFVARLVSRSNPSEEIAEIPTDEVSPADQGLLKAGARFYWTVGYRREPSGQRSRSSLLRMRRISPKAVNRKIMESTSNGPGSEAEEAWLNL